MHGVPTAATLLIACIFSSISIALAADLPWYTSLLGRFKDAGYGAATLEPEGNATRAVFVDLLIRLQGGSVHGPFGTPTFDDVPAANPNFYVFEEAAKNGWVKGLKDCAGTHPCLAAPGRTIIRAEAAAILARAFSLTRAEIFPAFSDLPNGTWLSDALSIATSRCVFHGDGEGKTIRPASPLNRAEMLAIFERSFQNLTYPDCRAPETSKLPTAPQSLQLSLPLPASPETVQAAASSSSVHSPAPVTQTSPQQGTTGSNPVPSPLSSLPTLSPLPSLPTISGSTSITPDPNLQSLISKYNEYVATFISLIDQTRNLPWQTTFSVLTSLRNVMDPLSTYYRYVTVAQQRALTSDERQIVTSTMSIIEAGLNATKP
ncbi:MAG: S-layer homology domain-containing protein [Candidatus Peregrinibacteria bacterium]